MPYNVLNIIQNKAYFEQPLLNWKKNEQSQNFFYSLISQERCRGTLQYNYALPLHKCFTNQWCNPNNKCAYFH